MDIQTRQKYKRKNGRPNRLIIILRRSSKKQIFIIFSRFFLPNFLVLGSFSIFFLIMGGSLDQVLELHSTREISTFVFFCCAFVFPDGSACCSCALLCFPNFFCFCVPNFFCFCVFPISFAFPCSNFFCFCVFPISFAFVFPDFGQWWRVLFLCVG